MEPLNTMLQKCCSNPQTPTPFLGSPVGQPCPSPLTLQSSLQHQLGSQGLGAALQLLIDNEQLCDVAFEVEGTCVFSYPRLCVCVSVTVCMQ